MRLNYISRIVLFSAFIYSSCTTSEKADYSASDTLSKKNNTEISENHNQESSASTNIMTDMNDGEKGEDSTALKLQSAEGKKNLRNSFTQYIELNRKSETDEMPGYNFSVNLKNKMIYSFDVVKVRVSYFLGSNCIDTNTVVFKNILPNKTLSVKGKENTSAKDIQLQLIEATSKSLELCYRLSFSGYTGEDPYHCK